MTRRRLRIIYHVGRSKVAHDEVKFTSFDDLGDLVSNTLNAHLGLLVVRGHLGRGYHVSCLALELLLNTAVKEKGDVSILLSL
jgi:hypothetical protein